MAVAAVNNPAQPPKRLQTALRYLNELNAIGIYLIPIRHHSPACAYAVKQALNELNPNDILIEAPTSFNELLDDLQHPDNKPPLAVLCQTQVIYHIDDNIIDDNTIDNVDNLANGTIDNTPEQTLPSDQTVLKPAKKQTIKRYHSAYYPFCDYSPEWVALNYNAIDQQPANRKTSPHKPNIDFIDLPWSQKVAHQENLLFGKNAEQNRASQSLQQEVYLAHSQYIKVLADKLHCRDHDEVWAHLFELDSNTQLQDWRAYFHKVLVWCAMSRLDYQDDVLANEGELIREAHMAERIIKRYQSNKNQLNQSASTNLPNSQSNMVIITGGFHTLALIETLHAKLIKKDTSSNHQKKPDSKSAKSALTTAPTTTTTVIKTNSDEAWLIRYSFDRLDALNGYASGMPSPAFYQACWKQRLDQDKVQNNHLKMQQTTKPSVTTSTVENDVKARERLIVTFLSDFARQLRNEQITQSNYVSVKTASEQAIRLADLRDHRLIGRYDLMDACTSSFLKGSDDSYQRFYQLLHEKLGGSKLGHVISTTRTPPVLSQVYELVRSNRFKLDDTLSKTAKLDVLRQPNHRTRSRLLHLLAFLEVGFARRLSGPDFLHGGQLHLLFEEWQYAWSPQVEARLIELSEQGSDIYRIAIKRLLSLRTDGGYQHGQVQQNPAQQSQGQSSSRVINLLIQASMMGLTEQMTLLFSEIKQILPNDPDLNSVLESAQHLLYLWTGRAFLELDCLQIPTSNVDTNTDLTTDLTTDLNTNSSQTNGNTELFNLIRGIAPTALFLLSQAQTPNDDQVNDTLTQVLHLHNILKQIQPIINENALNSLPSNLSANSDVLADFHHTLQRLLPSWQAIDLLVGAVHALQFVDGIINENELAGHLKQHFGVGAQAEQAVAYLLGMMQAVPTLFLHYRDLSQMIDSLVATWNNDTFVALLPDLRLAFTGLKPMQTNQLANQIAKLHNTSATAVTQYQGQLSEADMMQGVALNQQLQTVLKERGLLEWVKETHEL